jgi:hypothetical protein
VFLQKKARRKLSGQGKQFKVEPRWQLAILDCGFWIEALRGSPPHFNPKSAIQNPK